MISALLLAAALPQLWGHEVDRVMSDGMQAVVLFVEEGGCKGGNKSAAYIRANQRIEGCWFEKDGIVWVLWSDGDHTAAPSSNFKHPQSA